MIDFFKSGDYKNDAMANYIQRNYADMLMRCKLLADAVVWELRRIEKDRTTLKEHFRFLFAHVADILQLKAERVYKKEQDRTYK